MNSKFVAMTMVGLMVIQSGAMANTSRVEGIGNAAIENAKAKLNALQSDVDALDATLAKAEANVIAREKSTLLSVTNVTGAALGAGMTALAYFTLQRTGTVGVNRAIAIGAGLFTVASGITGYLDGNAKGETVTVDTAKQIQNVRDNVKASFSDLNDDDTNQQLAALDTRLQYLLGDLGRFNQEENEAAKAQVKAQLAQVIGVALTVTGGSLGRSDLVTLGSVIFSAGNISTLLRSLDDSQAELILKEIKDTRKLVQATFIAQ